MRKRKDRVPSPDQSTKLQASVDEYNAAHGISREEAEEFDRLCNLGLATGVMDSMKRRKKAIAAAEKQREEDSYPKRR